MAMCDYYPCDVCGGKAQYDADIDWYEGISVAIVCASCTKTHRAVAVPLDSEQQTMSQTDPKLDELLDTWRVAVDSYSDDTRSRSAIHSHLRTAVEQERKACAKIADDNRVHSMGLCHEHGETTKLERCVQLSSDRIAKAIRARSTTQPTETGATTTVSETQKLNAQQTVEVGMQACLPPDAPLPFTVARAVWEGRGSQREAVADVVMFDGQPARVAVSRWGDRLAFGGWTHRWISLEGGDIWLEGKTWMRVSRAEIEAGPKSPTQRGAANAL